MRARTLGYGTTPAALEYEAEFISNLVTDSTIEVEPLMATHQVARISSKGHLCEAWLKDHHRHFYQRDMEGKRAHQQHELRSGRFPAQIAESFGFLTCTQTVLADEWSYQGVAPC